MTSYRTAQSRAGLLRAAPRLATWRRQGSAEGAEALCECIGRVVADFFYFYFYFFIHDARFFYNIRDLETRLLTPSRRFLVHSSFAPLDVGGRSMLLIEGVRSRCVDAVAVMLRCGPDPLAAPQPAAEGDKDAGVTSDLQAHAADALMSALRFAAYDVATCHAALASACEEAVDSRAAEFRDGAAVSRLWSFSFNAAKWPSDRLGDAASVFCLLWAASDRGCGAPRDAVVVEIARAATPIDVGLRRRPAAAPPAAARAAQRASREVAAALALLRASPSRGAYPQFVEQQLPQQQPPPPPGPLHLLRAMRRVIVTLDRRFDDESMRDEPAAAFGVRCAHGALQLRMASAQGLLAAAAAAPPQSRAACPALRCRLVGC